MSAEAILRIKPEVWGDADNRIPVLLVEGRSPRAGGDPGSTDNVLLNAALLAGMTLVTDPSGLVLPTPGGWSARLGESDELTLDWPYRRPLLRQIRVGLPGVWRWAAARRSAVVVLIGSGMNLDEPLPDATVLRQNVLPALAESGLLAGAAVRFLHKGPLSDNGVGLPGQRRAGGGRPVRPTATVD